MLTLSTWHNPSINAGIIFITGRVFVPAQYDYSIVYQMTVLVFLFQALLVWVPALWFMFISTFESLPDYEPPYGEKLNPKPFQYEYGLQSQESGAAFSKKEIQVEFNMVYTK